MEKCKSKKCIYNLRYCKHQKIHFKKVAEGNNNLEKKIYNLKYKKCRFETMYIWKKCLFMDTCTNSYK